ncbi:MAG TPA: hypothetical protein VLG12_01135 [Candidatus Saccharimonadales bacterium]|nr:hypothetical protein [Candidatus Saccharimonadales bacterium]
MKWFPLLLLLFIAVLFESTITNLPLVLIVLFCAAVVLRNSTIFLWSFFSGIFLDALKLAIIGESSLFFLLFLTAAFLYERKFETQSMPFVLLFSFFGSVFYLWILGNNYIFPQAVLSMMIAFGIFWIWLKLQKIVA